MFKKIINKLKQLKDKFKLIKLNFYKNFYSQEELIYLKGFLAGDGYKSKGEINNKSYLAYEAINEGRLDIAESMFLIVYELQEDLRKIKNKIAENNYKHKIYPLIHEREELVRMKFYYGKLPFINKDASNLFTINGKNLVNLKEEVDLKKKEITEKQTKLNKKIYSRLRLKSNIIFNARKLFLVNGYR